MGFFLLGIGDIAAHVERDFHALCQAFASLYFLFADTVDDRETASDSVLAAKLCKLNQSRKARLAELRTANRLIFLYARCVEGNIDEIDFIFQIGHNITLVDKVALTVGVQTGFEPLFVEEIAKRDHFRYLIGRLAKAAENDFLETAKIAKALCVGNHLFYRRIAVAEPQIVAVIARTLVTHAKIAAVGALVRQIDVQIPIQRIEIGILAVFVLFFVIALILSAVLVITAVLLLRLFLLLFGRLGLGVLSVLPVLLLLLGLIGLVFILLALIIPVSLRVLILRFLHVLLARLILAGLSVLVILLTAVTAAATVTATSSASTAVAAVCLHCLFVFVLIFFHRIISV